MTCQNYGKNSGSRPGKEERSEAPLANSGGSIPQASSAQLLAGRYLQSCAELHDLRGPPIAVARPCFHQLAAALERIAALVGALHSVADGVSEGSLNDLPRKARALPCPGRKARTKSMDGGAGIYAFQECP